jgi:hypothetical protein
VTKRNCAITADPQVDRHPLTGRDTAVDGTSLENPRFSYRNYNEAHRDKRGQRRIKAANALPHEPAILQPDTGILTRSSKPKDPSDDVSAEDEKNIDADIPTGSKR